MEGEREEKSNVRLYDFLENMGMRDRLLTVGVKIEQLSAPNFSKAQITLQEQREKGLAFIEENLRAALQQKKNHISEKELLV